MTTLKSAPGSGAGILSIGPGAIAVVAMERGAKRVDMAKVLDEYMAGRAGAERKLVAYRGRRGSDVWIARARDAGARRAPTNRCRVEGVEMKGGTRAGTAARRLGCMFDDDVEVILRDEMRSSRCKRFFHAGKGGRAAKIGLPNEYKYVVEATKE